MWEVSRAYRAIAAFFAAVCFGFSLFVAGVSAQETAPEPVGESSMDLEGRLEAALAAAEAALAAEEARLDDLAARHSRRTLADGRPSSAQAAANVRLWERRIRELETSERELRETLNGVLASLGADLAALTGRLSARRVARRSAVIPTAPQAKLEQAARGAARQPQMPAVIPTAPRIPAVIPTTRDRAEREKAESEWVVGRIFRDCPACPEMVVVPAGSYMMGSPSGERERIHYEGPVHRVTIGQKFAVGVYEVTRGEFAHFVRQTNRAMGNTCQVDEDGEWANRSGRTWRNPGFSQRDDHPVVCVSWNDAAAYVRWLSRETGERYRLLSESEWEYVARAGTRTARYWGTSESGQCRHANGADWRISCNDGYARTSPVGSYTANGFGLYDVLGNVREWTQDCWNDSYQGAPNDDRAWEKWEKGNCGWRMARGGSWADVPRDLRSAYRIGTDSGIRSSYLGFRLARTLTSGLAKEEGDLSAQATMEKQRASTPEEQDAIRSYLGYVFQALESHKRNLERYLEEIAGRRRLSGRVVLRFTVRWDGEVVNLDVVEATGHDSFREAALRALSQVRQLPPFPNEIQRRELLVEVPLSYSIGAR